jgi:putative SOS response-associated peptidase YedK
MPAVLGEEQFAAWLDSRETRPDRVIPLLVPYPADQLECWPVGERVNSTTVEGAELLQPVDVPPAPKWTQPSLFEAG